MKQLDKSYLFRPYRERITMWDPASDIYHTLIEGDTIQVLGNLVSADTPTVVVTILSQNRENILPDDRRVYFILNGFGNKRARLPHSYTSEF